MIVLGRIAAPFGVQGWVKVQAYGDEPASWGAMPRWWLAPDSAAANSEWRALPLEAAKAHGRGLVAKFQGVDDRDAAAALNGHYVGAPREALPHNSENEYYWADLVGLEVINLAGERLGRVESLITSGANEVLCVGAGAGAGAGEAKAQRLLPFVAAVVQKVDIAGGQIRVNWGKDW